MSNKVEPGKQHLFDRAEPPVEAGGYFVRRIHDVETAGGKSLIENRERTAAGDHLHQDFAIEVQAPRTALQPADILGMFPAPGETEALTERVAHIALRRRTLPWERSFNNDDQAPWMMLLLFAEGEAELKRGTLSQMGLSLSRLPGSTAVTWIEVPRKILREVVPHPTQELRHLAHVRRVSRRDQEGEKDDDGDIAMVLGNRLPEPRDPGAATGVAHLACLVSLEGVTDSAPWWPNDDDMEEEGLLPEFEGGVLRLFRGVGGAREEVRTRFPTGDPELFRPGGGFVFRPELIGPVDKLLVLHHWSFKSGTAGDFESRMTALGNSSATGGVAAFGEDLAVTGGYAELDHRGRGGDPGRALYRGPLAPTAGNVLDPQSIAVSADALRVQLSGDLENVSYASAFELGRLLAMADPAMLRALIEWRRRRARGIAGGRLISQTADRLQLDGLLHERFLEAAHRFLEPLPDTLLGPLVDRFSGGGVIDPAPLGNLASDPTELGLLSDQVLGLNQAAVLQVKGQAALAALDPAAVASGGSIFEPSAVGTHTVPDLGAVDVSVAASALGPLEAALMDAIGLGPGRD